DDFVPKPIELSVLQAKVTRLLAAPAKALASLGGGFGPSAAPPVEGGATGWASGLANRVVELFASRQSGFLQLKRGELSMEVAFVNGFPVDVFVPFRRENVGLFLIQQGRLTEVEYDRALRRMIEKKISLEAALGQEGLV